MLTNSNSTMGIEEMLLERAEKRGRIEGREEGKEDGREESKTVFVNSLLQNTDFDEAKIAMLASVDVNFVTSIKAQQGK